MSLMAPAQAGGGVLARLGKASVQVKLLPLISKSLETGAIVLDGLEINLVRDEGGNWNLPESPVKDVKVVGQNVVVTTTRDEQFSFNYQVEALTVSKAAFTLDDRMTKSRAGVSNFTLKRAGWSGASPSPWTCPTTTPWPTRTAPGACP